MEVRQLVKEAKNGSKEAIKLLEEHYLDIFKNNVRRFCGEEYVEESMYDYSNLIEEYLDSHYIEDLDNFLRRRSKLYPKEKIFKRQLGDKINFNNEDELNFIIDHYTDTFYEKIKCFNSVLDENDLYVYALNLMKYFIFNLNFSCDIRVLLNARVYRELEFYKNNNELLLKKYILINGYDEKIANYYSKKCKYILEDYINNYGYNFLKEEYNNIIENAIMKLNNSNNSVEVLVEKNILKRIKEEKVKEKEYIASARKGSDEAAKILSNNYSYIMNSMYNKYKDNTDLDEFNLKKIIEEKYKEFMWAYINGTSNTEINKYLSTRLNNLMRKIIIKYSTNSMYINDKDMYSYLIDSYLKDVDDNIPKEEAKEELTNAYYNLLQKRKYCLKVNKDLERSVNDCLKHKVGIINKRYIDDLESKDLIKTKHPNKK